MTEIQANLDALESNGFVVIEGALTGDEVEQIHGGIERARDQGWQEGYNEVGNMWFDTLIEREPRTFAPLVAHPGVRPYLDALMGKQCQLRSHIPHQGAKERDDMQRSNVVCHYQATPMYEGIWFVSRPRGFAGTFPLATQTQHAPPIPPHK